METNHGNEVFAQTTLTPRSVSSEYGVPLNTVYAWIHTRRVASIRLGKRVFVPRSELERLVREGTRPATPVRGRGTGGSR